MLNENRIYSGYRSRYHKVYIVTSYFEFSTRFMLFDHDGQPIASQQLEHEQIMPKQGWVEQNPMEILENTRVFIKFHFRK